MSKITRDHMIALRYWQNGGTSFTCMLFTLMQKADVQNSYMLATAYPGEAAALVRWMKPDGPEWLDNELNKIKTEAFQEDEHAAN